MPMVALVCFWEFAVFLCGASAVNLRLPTSALHWLCRCHTSYLVLKGAQQ